MPHRPLRFATFLAPNLFDVYAFIVRRVGQLLGVPAELSLGADYAQAEHADAAFLCGLAYVELVERGCPLEAVAAPVLHGQRYGGRPVYYSDVIVHHDSPFRCFADLRGRSWSYNEPYSQSGYGITRYRLVELGETNGFFGRVVEAGWHERSIRLVCSGEVDATAIDAHVLALTLRDLPDLAGRLRVIDSLGPSTIQPVVVSRRLPEYVRAGVRAALLGLAETVADRAQLARGFVDRFVAVRDASYDDLRQMRDACRRANFLTLR
ncbi:MAG: PhnD/SsuA/transferrin family substrate-binding protein [Planctomycetes bacterium]|nr:PhnD/SsuA/transferrin family substrate-binding protein [Planctomycetota bacterium]